MDYPIQRSKTDKIPQIIRQDYLDAQNNPDLLSLRDDIALLDARRNQLMGFIDSGINPKDLSRIGDLLLEFETAVANRDTAKSQKVFKELKGITESHTDVYEQWKEVLSLLEAKRRLIEAERRRIVDLTAMVDSATAMRVINDIYSIIINNIKDEKVLRQIKAELQTVLSERLNAT